MVKGDIISHIEICINFDFRISLMASRISYSETTDTYLEEGYLAIYVIKDRTTSSGFFLRLYHILT